ncbi:vacuolar protein sorting vps16 [Anaeramoeba flamelloides]|uniref:Vacuolar protein sorting vps16 n=1 Tax=Anaeramoeba flamelloides TaxID=1746091 RepID=A0AAV8AC29_9EUKA|nr:vacuolar protein sorting vps16 [Anaeramoeba flamelloides]
MENPSVHWNQFDRYYYQKRLVFHMGWNEINLDHYLIESAPFGGLIALLRDDQKIINIKNIQTNKNCIFIYTCSGKLISELDYGDKQRVKAFGWTLDEKLIIVYDDCEIVVFDIFGEKIKTKCITSRDSTVHLVYKAKVWHNGAVILTKKNRLFIVENLSQPRFEEYSVPENLGIVSDLEILQPKFSLTGHTEVFISNLAKNLFIIDNDQTLEIEFEEMITNLKVSPTGRLLAYYTETGNLHVISTDFKSHFLEFQMNSKIKPKQIAWCSSDTVLLNFEKKNTLLMVAPSQSFLKYEYDEPLYLMTEEDGIRILTNSCCEFLSKVPEVVVNIFGIGSTSFSSLLYDASQSYEKESSKGDEVIRSKMDLLPKAITDCITASSWVFQRDLQKKLLNAAAIGKSYLDNFVHDIFADMCKDLRVLNEVRGWEIGMPLTYRQFEKIGIDLLIERLINRKHHYVALKICEYLRIRKDRVLVRWACEKVKSETESDEQILKSIISKLGKEENVSFASIASVAYSESKNDLAIKLLDYEKSASEQVPLLINMKNPGLALIKAIECANPDLIYLVLLYLLNTLDINENSLFQILSHKDMAINLLIKYCKHKNKDLLYRLYSQLKREPKEVGLLKITESLSDKINLEMKLKIRNESLIAFGVSKNNFLKKITEDNIKLVKLQQDYQQRLELVFIGLSINQTTAKLLELDLEKEAKKMKKTFKIPNDRYWWIKLRALAKKHRWKKMYAWAKNEKSPIGYEPFVEICIKNRVGNEALNYIPLVKDPYNQVKFYLRLNKFEQAADIAIKEKNQNLLQHVKSLAPKNLNIPSHI